MYQTPRHRVFISYYHDDQAYKDWFIQMMGEDIVDESESGFCVTGNSLYLAHRRKCYGQRKKTPR